KVSCERKKSCQGKLQMQMVVEESNDQWILVPQVNDEYRDSDLGDDTVKEGEMDDNLVEVMVEGENLGGLGVA
ncbi:hypothetical protein KI387_041831, partial [Taxus chinensis]